MCAPHVCMDCAAKYVGRVFSVFLYHYYYYGMSWSARTSYALYACIEWDKEKCPLSTQHAECAEEKRITRMKVKMYIWREKTEWPREKNENETERRRRERKKTIEYYSRARAYSLYAARMLLHAVSVPCADTYVWKREWRIKYKMEREEKLYVV